jgi:phospholipid/cholesterol/gamma-HCH transport system substrate-binding protein
MRTTRTVREGSVGLLLLLGLGLFLGVVLWLRGLTIGKRSYNAIIEFVRVNGMQEGGMVRYRGVNVGNISVIRPGPNGVEVEVEISPANLIIPRDAVIEANQSGLISEVGIDITPQKQLPSAAVVAKPLDKNCDRNLIICDGSRLQGQIGISTDELIRFSTRFASVYSDPRLYENVSEAAKNASVAAAGVSQLTRDLSGLTKQISALSNQTATQLGATTEQIRLTTGQVNRLVTNLNSLVTTNRTSLTTALNNITKTSEQLRVTVNDLTPTLNRINQGELVQNLETLSANAVQASANLRDISNALNSPTNLLVLQQTLDSARVTFQNAQKITSDLDELTGDPAFRENIRQLINGLSGLVSSTQQLQQQVEVAETLDSLKAAVNRPELGTPILGSSNKPIPSIPTFDSATFSPPEKSSQPITFPDGTSRMVKPRSQKATPTVPHPGEGF